VSATPTYGGTVVFPAHESPATFDLHWETSYAVTQPVAPIHNSLLTYDLERPGILLPDLAEEWHVSADSLTMSFRLRQGVRFHDGSPFTCRDAKSTLDKMTDGRVAIRRSELHSYASSECVDASTLVVRLKQPQASFLFALAGARFEMHKAEINAKALEYGKPRSPLARDPAAFLVGTGPFRFATWTPGVDFTAQRNPDYFKEKLPYLDGYRVVVMADLTAIFAAFRARQLTMTGIARHLEPSQAAILRRDHPEAVILTGPRNAWHNIVWNMRREPWKDVRVRRAMWLAIDQYSTITAVAEGWGSMGGWLAPHLPYALPQGALERHPFFGQDMEARRQAARRLLAEAGYPNGFKANLLVRTGPLYEAGAIANQEDLRKVGIDLTIQLLDFVAIRDRQERGDFDLYTVPSTTAIDDPDGYYSRFICANPLNYMGYCNPQFDRLFQEQAAALDITRRIELTREIERLFLEDPPDHRTYYWWQAMAHWEGLRNWHMVLGDTVFNFGRLERVWCDGGRCN
jgi:peptide/nickel transport system substrate-binding protein